MSTNGLSWFFARALLLLPFAALAPWSAAMGQEIVQSTDSPPAAYYISTDEAVQSTDAGLAAESTDTDEAMTLDESQLAEESTDEEPEVESTAPPRDSLGELETATKHAGKAGKAISNWDLHGKHAQEQTKQYIEAIEREKDSILEIEKIVSSDRFARDVAGAVGFEQYDKVNNEARAANRYILAAAQVASLKGNTSESAQHLIAALRLAAALGGSNKLTLQFIRTILIRTEALDLLAEIYEHASPTSEEASDLTVALASPVDELAAAHADMAFLKASVNIDPSYRVYRGYVDFLSLYQDVQSDPASLKANARMAEILGMAQDGKTAQVAAIQREDLAAAEALRTSAVATYTAPYFTLLSDPFWQKVLKSEAVSPDMPVAFLNQSFLNLFIRCTNSDAARTDLAIILLSLRGYEAEHGAVPDSLSVLDDNVASRVDPFDGHPYRYSVVKDKDDKPVSFKIYSIGPDLKDNGGISRSESKTDEYDIVVKAEALSSGAAK